MSSALALLDTPENALAGRWRVHLDKQVSAGQISPATAQTYSIGLARFILWGKGRALSDTPVLDWLGDLRGRYAAATCNVWLYGVRNFFSWALALGLTSNDPTRGVKAIRSRISGHKRLELSNLEVNRLLDARNARDRAIMYVLAFSGCRGAELISCDMGDVSQGGKHVQIRVKGKGSQEKGELLILAHPQAQDALFSWLAERGGQDGPLFWSFSPRSKGARITLRGLRQIIKDAYRRAGIVGKLKTTHSLRHSAITSAIRNGAAIQDVQKMARHRSAATTMNYFHHEARLENPAEAAIKY